MKAIIELNTKVLSYHAIPQELVEDHLEIEQFPNDCYVKWTLDMHEDYVYDKLDSWIIENYPELIGKDFLIDMDI